MQLIFTGCTFALCQRAVGTERTWRNLPDNLSLSTPLFLLASFHSELHESRCPSFSLQGLWSTQKFRLIYIWGMTASILDSLVISVFSLILQSLQSQKLWRLHKWHRRGVCVCVPGGGGEGGVEIDVEKYIFLSERNR